MGVAGEELNLGRWVLDKAFVREYLDAVEDTSPIYESIGAVPPMALAARALSALIQTLGLPSGTIHASQELECREIVKQGDEVLCRARVSRPRQRGDWSLMAAEFTVSKPDGGPVLAGKSTVLVPVRQAGGD